jgi:hypothetical protein
VDSLGTVHVLWRSFDQGVYYTCHSALVDVASGKLCRAPVQAITFSVYPNPFNSNTRIQYSLTEKSRITLQMIDVLGRVVRNLVSGDVEGGEHVFCIDAHDLASGPYFVRLQSGARIATKSILLIR